MIKAMKFRMGWIRDSLQLRIDKDVLRMFRKIRRRRKEISIISK
jgi:hypothetical protein